MDLRSPSLAVALLFGGGCASPARFDTGAGEAQPPLVQGQLLEGGTVARADPAGRATPLRAPTDPGDFPDVQPPVTVSRE